MNWKVLIATREQEAYCSYLPYSKVSSTFDFNLDPILQREGIFDVKIPKSPLLSKVSQSVRCGGLLPKRGALDETSHKIRSGGMRSVDTTNAPTTSFVNAEESTTRFGSPCAPHR
jgi:hypothetical protein